MTKTLDDTWADKCQKQSGKTSDVDHGYLCRKKCIIQNFTDKESFFDREYHSILDSFHGHDIETAWLMDRGVEVLGRDDYRRKMTPITKDLTNQIFHVAFDGHSLANECDRGVVNENRVWWVQAETVIGFLNGYEKEPERTEYLEAAVSEWEFIKEYVIDKRTGSEWFWEVKKDGSPIEGRPVVEPWKCPYHNGRMCMELIKRTENRKLNEDIKMVHKNIMSY